MSRFNPEKAAEETWEALLSADLFVEGDFTFASGAHATLKVETERLYSRPKELAIIMGHFAVHPSIQDADVLLYVPDGMRQFMTTLGNELGKPVADTIRKPGAVSRYDFVFASPEDEELAHSAQQVVIGEDIVSTLGSVAGVRKLLKPEQHVDSLSILLRGTVNPEFQEGLTDHYLLVRQIPTDKDVFRRSLAENLL